jgi:hypothetical protein
MSATLSYPDAVDLLDADHKLAQKQFLDYQAMSETGHRRKRNGSWP